MHLGLDLQHLRTMALAYGGKLLIAVVVLVVGAWVAKTVARLTRTAMIKGKVDPTLASFTNNVVYAGLLIFVILASLGKIGIQTTSFIAFLGAAGLAIGLAFQASLSSLSSGVLLILFRPFKVGDSISVAGVQGTVIEIQIFTTVLATDDKKRIFIPNSKITSEIIVNSTPAPDTGLTPGRK